MKRPTMLIILFIILIILVYFYYQNNKGLKENYTNFKRSKQHIKKLEEDLKKIEKDKNRIVENYNYKREELMLARRVYRRRGKLNFWSFYRVSRYNNRNKRIYRNNKNMQKLFEIRTKILNNFRKRRTFDYKNNNDKIVSQLKRQKNHLINIYNRRKNYYNAAKKKLDDYETRIDRYIIDFDEKKLGINKFYIKATQTKDSPIKEIDKYLCVDNNSITLRKKPYVWELVNENNTPLVKDIFLMGKDVIIRDPRTETYLQWDGIKKNLVVIENKTNIFWNLKTKLDGLFTTKNNKSIERIRFNGQGPYDYRFDFLSPIEARNSYFVQPVNDKAKKIYVFDGKEYLHKNEDNLVTLKVQPFEWELILFTETINKNSNKTITSERNITIGEMISIEPQEYFTENKNETVKKRIKLKVPGEAKYLSWDSLAEKLAISENNDSNKWILHPNYGLFTFAKTGSRNIISLNDIKIDGKKHYFLFEHYNPSAPIIPRVVKENSILKKFNINNIPNNFNEKDWITIKKNKDSANNNDNNPNNRKCKAVSVGVDADETQYVWVITKGGDVLHAKLNKDTKVKDIQFKLVGNTKLEYIKAAVALDGTQHVLGTNNNIIYYLEVKPDEEIYYNNTKNTNTINYNRNLTDFNVLEGNLKQVSIDINNNNKQQILGITPKEQKIDTKYYGNISRTTQVTVNKILQKHTFNSKFNFNEITLEKETNKLFVHLSVAIGKDNTPVYYAVLEGGVICNFDEETNKWVNVMQLPDKQFFSVEVKIDKHNNHYLYAVDSKANFYFIKDIFEESNNFQKIEYSSTRQFTGVRAFDIGLNKNNKDFHHLWIIDAYNNLKYKKINTSIPVPAKEPNTTTSFSI